MTIISRLVELGHGVLLLPEGGGPAQLEISDSLYLRFLNKIYIPTTTDQLSDEQIVVINRERERMLCIDSQFHHRDRVRSAFRSVILQIGKGNLLEIGCGFYPLSDELPYVSYRGVDIDQFAVVQNRKKGHDCRISLEKYDHSLQSFDLTIALFSMHFKIRDEILDVLAYNLAEDALFVFNMATRDAAIREGIPSRLRQRGMEVRGFMVAAESQDAIFVATTCRGRTRAGLALASLVNELGQPSGILEPAPTQRETS